MNFKSDENLTKKEQLLRLIPKTKWSWTKSINACSLTSMCITLDNKSSIWHSKFSHLAFSVESPLAIKVSLKNKNDWSGIILYGKYPQKHPWWKDVVSIFVGINKDGKRLYADVRNGSSINAYLLLNKPLDNKLQIFYIFFLQDGKNFLITDEFYKELIYIDINDLTGNKFPEGLFPDKKFYVGYDIAPFSSLSISQLLILPIKD